MANIRESLEEFRDLLAEIIATSLRVKRKILAQQEIIAHAANLFDEVLGRRDETVENTAPARYAEVIGEVALVAANGDEIAVNVAVHARVDVEDICSLLEKIDECIQGVGGGDHKDLFDRTEGSRKSPKVSGAAPAPGGADMYAKVTSDLEEIRDRLTDFQEKVMEAVSKYADGLGELVAGDDDDDDDGDAGIDDADVEEVKHMYGRCLIKLVTLNKVCRGLLFMLTNLSGYYDPPL